jgi:phospholipase/carboxylesterase
LKSELPDCIEINPSGDPAAVIIWLHGLGADGHDFEAIVPQLNLPASLPVRFVFPHAPRRAVTINGGVVMRAWFDIYDVNLTADSIDHEQFRESSDMVRALIEREQGFGVASNRILLAGFSQGGAIVLHTGLHYEKTLAGILAMSMHLPTLPQSASSFNDVGRAVPIMMAHGQTDPVIPLDKAVKTRQGLTDLGYAVDWREYPMPHTVCTAQIEDIRAWLLDILA